MASLGFCTLGSPAFERFDWLDHLTTSGPEFAKEEDCSASCVHGKPPRRLQTDFPYQVLVTSGHTTVWQKCVSSLRRGHANLLCIVPILSDDPRRESSCRLLENIDLCNAQVEEIPEFAFVHCTSLKEVLLPTTLHTIRVKAFMNCSSWSLPFPPR